MDTDGLTSLLEGEGFSPYQARAYVALLELGDASASRLADASDVPGPRIYDVLRDLADEGYVETYDDGTLHARVTSPDAVISDLRSHVDSLTDAAVEIEDRWTRPEPRDRQATVVNNFSTVLERTEDAIESADYRLQLCLTHRQFERLADALGGAHDRGVRVQVSLHSVDPADVDRAAFEGVCDEVRTRRRGAPFLAIADHTTVCYAANSRRPVDYGVVIDDRIHASVFLWYYLSTLWELWDPLYTDRDDSLPRTYLEVRRCVQEIAPVLAEGGRIDVRVVGQFVDSGERCRLSGEVVDVEYEGEAGPGGPLSLQSLAGKATVVLGADEGTYTVGGFGALVEDVEADRIVVESIEGVEDDGASVAPARGDGGRDPEQTHEE